MGFLKSFSKTKEDDALYHGTARVLINGCCDVSESEELSKHLSLTEDEFNDFHIQKRNLALKTVIFTATITMDVKKRNFFNDIFINNLLIHDKVMTMEKEMRDMYLNQLNAVDNAYLNIFNYVTENLNATNKAPVIVLMESFSKMFAALLNEKDNDEYIEIGKKIFQKYYKIATNLFCSL